MKCWTGWITNWNQDCQEKYQPQICRWYHSNGRKWRVTRASWWRWKRREKAGLKLNIQKSKIMASTPTISWQIEGGKWKQWHFIFLGSKIIANRDCRHEKQRLLLGRKAMTNLDRVLKSRDITLLTKVPVVKAMIFPVVTYGCKNWM